MAWIPPLARSVSFMPGERLCQSFQDQVRRLNDALIAWTQVRFKGLAGQALQTIDVTNGDLIALLG